MQIISPSGSVRFSSVFPGDTPKDVGRPGLTAISPDAKFAFTPIIQPDRASSDAIYVTPLSDNGRKVQMVSVGGNSECSYMTSTPISAGAVLSNGDYIIYVGRECRVKCASNPSGIYFSKKVLKLRYRPSTNTLKMDPKLIFDTNQSSCSADYVSFGTLRLLDGELYGLMFDNSKTIKLLRFSTKTIHASLSGFEYCNSWSFTIASNISFYGTCVIPSTTARGADTSIPSLVRVSGDKLYPGPPPPAGSAGDSLSRFQRVYDSVTTQPNSGSVYTFLEGGQFGSATVYKLDKDRFAMPPKPVLELKPDILVSGAQTLRIGQLLIVP